MRKKRDPGSDESRSDRLKKNAEGRKGRAVAEEEAIDAAVKQSIKRYGA